MAPVALTVAVFDGWPQAAVVTLALMVTVSEVPGARVPRGQLTFWPLTVQLPEAGLPEPLKLAVVGTTPVGRVSVTVVPVAEAVALEELPATMV